jgi:threonine dehydratase
MSDMILPEFTDVQAAAERIRPFVHRTPVMTCETINRIAGRKIYLKCEMFQKTGAFKYRGATNAVLQLTDQQAARGVVTHSSGNHGQALARAAMARHVPAYIVMPKTASQIKKNAVRDYGATIIECEPALQEREQVAMDVLTKTGGTLIPPFDHPHVIAGQGTAALEFLEDIPDLQGIVAPIGGGGLIAGLGIAVKGINPSIRVFGAEPNGANAAALSKNAGERVTVATPKSLADGLLANYLGTLTWPVIRDHVERVITVSDNEILAAMRLVWERAKLIVEPSGAVSLAVVLSEAFRQYENLTSVGVILSGGNVNLDKMLW